MKKAIIIALSLVCLTSLMMFTACSTNKIATPTNITVDEDNNMTWDENTDAKGYEVEITNHDTSEVQTFTPRKELFSLADLDEGDYDIRIKALPASRKNEESDWSSTLYFHKIYETGCVYTLINNDREFEITRVGRAKGAFTIEDEYRGKPVTRIADGAFKKSKSITGVTIGNNVTYVGATAFASCYNLVKVTFADTVSEIGESCFLSCYALEEVNIPSGIKSIPNYMFQFCRSLEKITIPETVESIGEQAFSDCEALTELTIPDSVTDLSDNAFEECSAVTKVKIGSGLTTLNSNVFLNCKALQEIDFGTEGNLKYILSKAFAGCSSLTSVTLPDKLEYLGSNAFLSCSNLEELNIPDSVTFVGASVVYKTKIQSINDSISGNKLFFAGKWLVGVSNDLKHSVIEISNDGFTVATELTDEGEVQAKEKMKEITIPAGTVGIAASLFQQAKLLEKVTLPNSLKYVCQAAFRKCANLNYFDAYTSNLEELGPATFYECEKLTQLRVSAKLTTISEYCFYKCVGLKMPANEEQYSQIVPDTVKEIGRYAFFNSGIWTNSVTGGVIYAGKWIVGFSDSLGSVVSIKDGTVGIADYAFAGAEITGVDNTASVKYLGKGAFYACSSLIKYDLSSNIRKIDNFTFYACEKLNDLGNQDPTQLEYVGRSAFYACTSLKSINLSQCPRLDTIGLMAFGYSGLESVILPEYTLTQITPYAFYECNSLKSITVPSTVTTIGTQAFFGCDALEEVNFKSEYDESALESIGDSAFYRCYSLKAVDLPDSVKTISDSAFYGCSAVESLNLGSSVEVLGNNAFANLTVLKELVLPSSLKRIGSYAFSGLDSLSAITLSKSAEWLGAYAFFQCDFATVYTEFTSAPEDWHGRWNASYRPVVWGVTLSDDKTYVVSFTKTANSITNENEYSAVTAPVRVGYDFKGWATTEGSSTPVYGAIDIAKVADGTTLYAVWEKKSEVTE